MQRGHSRDTDLFGSSTGPAPDEGPEELYGAGVRGCISGTVGSALTGSGGGRDVAGVLVSGASKDGGNGWNRDGRSLCVP